MQVSVMTNKTLRMLLVMLWCILQRKPQMSFLVYVKPQKNKKTSARKSLCLSTNIFYVKKETEKLRVESEKSKRRSTKVVNSLWTNKKNEKGIKNK